MKSTTGQNFKIKQDIRNKYTLISYIQFAGCCWVTAGSVQTILIKIFFLYEQGFFSSVLISSFSCGSNLFLVLHLVGVNYHRYYIYSCSVADSGAEGFTRV